MRPRILSPEQLKRMFEMRQKGMSYTAIAAWFTRNGTRVSHQSVREQCVRIRRENEYTF